VVFVSGARAEEKFLAEGHGVKRFFRLCTTISWLIGPKSDLAKVRRPAGTSSMR